MHKYELVDLKKKHPTPYSMGQCRGNRFWELDFNCIWILCSSYPECNCCEMWHWWTIVVLISVSIKDLLQHCNHSWQCTTFFACVTSIWRTLFFKCQLFGKPCRVSYSARGCQGESSRWQAVADVMVPWRRSCQMSWFPFESGQMWWFCRKLLNVKAQVEQLAK